MAIRKGLFEKALLKIKKCPEGVDAIESTAWVMSYFFGISVKKIKKLKDREINPMLNLTSELTGLIYKYKIMMEKRREDNK